MSKKNPHLVKPGSKVRLEDHDPGDTGEYRDGDDAPKAAKKRLDELRHELHKLQGLLFADNRHSLLILLQGIDASGKDGTIRHVLSGFTPIGVHVTAFKAPGEEELEHDFLWRIHKVVPRRGEIAIFNRSHYEDVLVARVRGLVAKSIWKKRYRQINEFERTLAECGTVVLKFFLHISRDEQKRRLQERLENPTKFWKFRLGDLDDRKHWDDYMEAYEDALTKCSTDWAPWTIVPADRKWYRNIMVAERISTTLHGLGMEFPPAAFDRSKVVIE